MYMHALMKHICVIIICLYTPVMVCSSKRNSTTNYGGIVLIFITSGIAAFVFMPIYADVIGISMFCMLSYICWVKLNARLQNRFFLIVLFPIGIYTDLRTNTYVITSTHPYRYMMHVCVCIVVYVHTYTLLYTPSLSYPCTQLHRCARTFITMIRARLQAQTCIIVHFQR